MKLMLPRKNNNTPCSKADGKFITAVCYQKDIQKGKEKKEDIEEILKTFSLLYEYYKRVLAVEEIKTWIEKRPQSDY